MKTKALNTDKNSFFNICTSALVLFLALSGCSQPARHYSGRAYLIDESKLLPSLKHEFTVDFVDKDATIAQFKFFLVRLRSVENPSNNSWVIDWDATCKAGTFQIPENGNAYSPGLWSSTLSVNWSLAKGTRSYNVVMHVRPKTTDPSNLIVAIFAGRPGPNKPSTEVTQEVISLQQEEPVVIHRKIELSNL